VGDRAFDADWLLEDPEVRGAEAVIPSKRNRTAPRDHDREMYGWRHLVDSFLAGTRELRAIATRHDRTAESFAAGLAPSPAWWPRHDCQRALMSPMTENQAQRVFNVLREDDTLFRVPADTVCEKWTTAKHLILTFKREGKKVGTLAGRFNAWWIDPEDEGSRVYHFEVGKRMVEVVADEWVTDEKKHVLKAGDTDVATIYSDRSISISWFEERR